MPPTLNTRDRLPGSFNLAAQSMGVTTRELTKLVESGQLASDEFLRNFIPTLNQAVVGSGALAAGLQTSRVAMQRFGTSFQLNVLGAFEAGAESGLNSFFNSLTRALSGLAPTLRVVGRVIGTVLEVIGGLIEGLSQIIRPFGILFDGIFGTSGEADLGRFNSELEATSGILALVGDLLGGIRDSFFVVFGLVQRFLDVLDGSFSFGINSVISENASRGETTGLIERLGAGFAEYADVLFTRGGRALGLDLPLSPSDAARSTPTAQINITATNPTEVAEIVNLELQNLFTVNMSTGN